MTPLEVGMLAPDFTAPNQWGEKYTLSNSIGSSWTLLIFYPANWGFICRNEIVEFRDRSTEFEEIGIKLLGISTNMVISHGLWSEQLQLPFPLISDPPGAIASLYGVLDDDKESFNKGRSNRALFLLDPNRVIKYVWLAENPWLEPDYDELISICRAVLNLARNESLIEASEPISAAK